MSGPLDPALLIARLKLAPALGFRQFGGAADLRAAQQANLAALPAVFVLAARDRAQQSSTANYLRQRVVTTLAVVYAVSNVADPGGKAAGDALLPLRSAVLSRLIGWAPTADSAPLQLASGDLTGFVDQLLWWQDLFTTDYYLEGPSS